MGIDSADTSQPPNGEICKNKSHLLSNNPARQFSTVTPLTPLYQQNRQVFVPDQKYVALQYQKRNVVLIFSREALRFERFRIREAFAET
jgi:hypothetical protein